MFFELLMHINSFSSHFKAHALHFFSLHMEAHCEL